MDEGNTISRRPASNVNMDLTVCIVCYACHCGHDNSIFPCMHCNIYTIIVLTNGNITKHYLKAHTGCIVLHDIHLQIHMNGLLHIDIRL